MTLPLRWTENIFRPKINDCHLPPVPTCYPVLALIVGGRDGLDDSKSPLATLPLVLLVIEQVRVVIFLFAKEVIFLVGVEIPGVQRGNYKCAHLFIIADLVNCVTQSV